MVVSSSPTVLRRYVGSELRRLREAAGLKREAVAEELSCSLSHVTHIEIWSTLPKPLEVKTLLPLYGAPERTESFLELVKAASKGQDWWLPFKGAAPTWLELLLSMEASAAQIESYDSMCVRGLFQTPAYAKELIRIGEPELSDEEVAHRVDLRMARQDVLTRRPEPPLVWSVLDESVLLRPFCDATVLAEQLEHLIKLLDLPSITLQVLPLETGPHAGFDGTFTILTFPPELVGDPGVAYTESRIGGVYYEHPAEIMRYRNTLKRVQAQARTPEESRAILTRRLEELT